MYRELIGRVIIVIVLDSNECKRAQNDSTSSQTVVELETRCNRRARVPSPKSVVVLNAGEAEFNVFVTGRCIAIVAKGIAMDQYRLFSSDRYQHTSRRRRTRSHCGSWDETLGTRRYAPNAAETLRSLLRLFHLAWRRMYWHGMVCYAML